MAPLNSQPFVSEADGRTRNVIITPAAGVDFAIQVPDGYFWDFLSLDARLQTSAVVNNRVPTFTFDDGANRVWRVQGQLLAANSGCDYLLGEGLTRDNTIVGFVYLPVPTDLRLFAGWRVSSSTALIDVGDQWQIVTMAVREFQTNPVTGPRASRRNAGLSFGAPRRPGRAY